MKTLELETEKVIKSALKNHFSDRKLSPEKIEKLNELLKSSFNEWIIQEINYFLNELETDEK